MVSVISNEKQKYLRPKQIDRGTEIFPDFDKSQMRNIFIPVYLIHSPHPVTTMPEATMRLNVPPDQMAAAQPPTWSGLDTWPRHRPAELMALAPARDADQARTLHRLAEIGFLPGEVLRVVSRGWLPGGPIAVRVGQSTFALRSHEAALLRVRAAPAEA